MAGAALGGGAFGNQDEQDALELVRATRRVEHEQKGSELAVKRDYAGALIEWQEALKWDSGNDPLKTGEILYRIGQLQNVLGERPLALETWTQSAAVIGQAEQAAATEPDPTRQIAAWARVAEGNYRAGRWKAACVAAEKAYRGDQQHFELLRSMRCDRMGINF